jgi:hypothetical protein
MRCRIDAARQAGDDRKALRGQIAAKALGHLPAIDRGIARTDDADAKTLQCRHIAKHRQHRRRIRQCRQRQRVIRLATHQQRAT